MRHDIPLCNNANESSFMIWKPHVTVAAVIEQDAHFLLVEERVDADAPLVLNQPAGHLDPGESLAEAVIRETLEETAYHFQPEALIAIYRWPLPDNSRTYLRFAFTGHITGHVPDRPLDEGIARCLWLTHAEIEAAATRLRSPLVLRALADYRAGRRQPLDMLIDVGS